MHSPRHQIFVEAELGGAVLQDAPVSITNSETGTTNHLVGPGRYVWDGEQLNVVIGAPEWYLHDGEVVRFRRWRDVGFPQNLNSSLSLELADHTTHLVAEYGTDSYGWEIIEGAGGLPSGSTVAAWGDYNSDGYTDLFVASPGSGGELYRNEGGTFSSVSIPAIQNVKTANWGDLNADGNIDLLVVYGDPSELTEAFYFEGDLVYS